MAKKYVKWKDMTPKQKKSTVIKGLILLLFTVGTILVWVFADQVTGENSIFNKSVSNNPVVDSIYQSIPRILTSIQIIVIATLISKGIRLIMKKGLTRTQRAITIEKLLDSFVKYLIAIIALLMVLSTWGVDTTALVASAGILSLVIGLGAQSMIADIIAGVFIVFEGDYQVGDIVVIDGWRGTVEEIGIRTTKIIDAGGNIKVVNNSAISTIINQTKELSLATCEVGIEYGESIEKVETVIRDNLDKIKERIPAIVEGPYYKGVKTLNTSSVDLLFIAKCKEEDLYQTQRDLNREIKLVFDKNSINIPFPQIVLNQPTEFKTKITKKMSAGAKEFVEEQKELSKDVDEKI